MNILQHFFLNEKNETLIHDLFQQMDEHIPYEEFSTNMKKCNDEQRFIINDIIHKKHKYFLDLYIFS